MTELSALFDKSRHHNSARHHPLDLSPVGDDPENIRVALPTTYSKKANAQIIP